MGAPHGTNPEACVLQYYINSSISPAASMALHSAWLDQMEAGLAHEVDTTLLMLPSFIRELPTGNEVGSYLAIDVGGTSLRLLHVVLSKDRSQIVRSLAEHRAAPPATHRNKVGYLQSQVQFIRLAIKAHVAHGSLHLLSQRAHFVHRWPAQLLDIGCTRLICCCA